MKAAIFSIFLFFVLMHQQPGISQYEIQSLNGKIKVEIKIDSLIHITADLNKSTLIKEINADLLFNKTSLLNKNVIKSYDKITVLVKNIKESTHKESTINQNYKQLDIIFIQDIILSVRVYNDGFAYRFITNREDEIEVNEIAEMKFSGDPVFWTSPIKGYSASYEAEYKPLKFSEMEPEFRTYLPLLAAFDDGKKILITESDVTDYPHMFLDKGNESKFNASFPPFPLETKLIGDRGSEVVKSANYIAKSKGKRNFPWRVFIMTEEDKDLVKSNMVYLLAEECKLENTDWIKPGKVAWDWWNALNLHGVDFRAGLNTDTYKYYIDFASSQGLEYIILDEGWSLSTTDISQPNPDLNLKELIAYGKEKNVDVILWASWRAIEDQFFVLAEYEKWGIAGVKVDFMNRADQWMVNFYERVAKEAAKHHLLVDFHGAFKPNGLHKTYPNVLTYEGVRGNENHKWSSSITPEHNLYLPFIRMVAGPMDYTPGAMRNYHSKEYQAFWSRPASQGTRCHQLALSVIYESPLQMLCDSPTNYQGEKESIDFLSSIPTTWDKLRVYEASFGEYLVLVREKEGKYFIAALNNNEKEREFEIPLDFLGNEQMKTTILQDGINADQFAEDYKKIEKTIERGDILTIKMAAGGGFVARIE